MQLWGAEHGLPTVSPRRIQLIEGAEFPRWSPDGELIALLKRSDLGSRYWRANELWIMDRTGQQARKLHTGQFYNPYVSWSLDSRLLAFEVDEGGKRYIYTVDWKIRADQTVGSWRRTCLVADLKPFGI